jgi:hypothetical protein
VESNSHDKTNPASGTAAGAPRRRKKTNAAPSSREIAQESAAIYPDTFATPPTSEEIAVEAYNIYSERGGEHGRELDDWLEAERRLSARRQTAGQEPTRR